MKPHAVVKVGTVLYLALLVGVGVALHWRTLPGAWLYLAAMALYLGIAGWVSISAVVSYRFLKAGLYATSWEQLPPRIQAKASEGYPAMEAAGFSLQAYAQQQSKVSDMDAAALLMTDESRTVMLGWNLIDSPRAQAQQVVMMSRATTGERICTAVAGNMLPIMMREGSIMVPQISDVRTLLSLHRKRLSHYLHGRVLEILPRGEVDTIAWINAEDAEDMQYKSSLGFFKPIGDGAWYRPTMWFALPMALSSLAPWKWLPRQWQKWQAAAEIRKVGWRNGDIPH